MLLQDCKQHMSTAVRCNMLHLDTHGVPAFCTPASPGDGHAGAVMPLFASVVLLFSLQTAMHTLV